MNRQSFSRSLSVLLGVAALSSSLALASSHREAPFITEHPKVDGTDFYLFRSYAPGRESFVTILANYNPLQDAYGGPNYFDLDPEALYRIHIDNDGDGVENLTFQFRINHLLRGLAIPVGPDGTLVPVPLKNIGQIGPEAATQAGVVALNSSVETVVDPFHTAPNLNLVESYVVQLIRGGPEDPNRSIRLLENLNLGGARFFKPVDNIGQKSIPNYAEYARSFIYDAAIPGCGSGRIFVGQRQEGFGVNLGEIFDLVNIGNPIGDPDGERSATQFKNITTFALEVPIECLTEGKGDVIGGWTTALLRRTRVLKDDPTFEEPALESQGGFVQVSRLGMPLVNEVVIGLPDKNRFNASQPKDDLQFATYVTNPTLPELLEILFGVEAPNNFPRTDLLAAFVTGIEGLNRFGFGEMARLNTAIPPTPAGSQSNLGVVGGDLAGFPNGRRPGDDVVDIELRVAMGLLCHAGLGLCNPDDAPSGLLPFTDGYEVNAEQFDSAFPYLRDPIPGSPNSVNGVGEK